MIKIDNGIIVKLDKITGILFYALEYYIYLKENDLNFKLFFELPESIHNTFREIIKYKYKEKYIRLFDFTLVKKLPKLYCKNLLVLDYSTFRYLSKDIIYKKCFYNYTNEEKSFLFEFKEFSSLKNIITFGDVNMGVKTINDYPLFLNFKMFKKIKIKKYLYYENKLKIGKRLDIIIDFHSSFDKLHLHRFGFDRANRLIPECNYYNKTIIVTGSGNRLDSIDLRLNQDIKELDINNSTFANFIKDALNETY